MNRNRIVSEILFVFICFAALLLLSPVEMMVKDIGVGATVFTVFVASVIIPYLPLRLFYFGFRRLQIFIKNRKAKTDG